MADYVRITADATTGFKDLRGFIFHETGGANPATVTFKDGGAGGTEVFSIRLAANESAGENWADHPITAKVGDWYVDLGGTGTIVGAVFGDKY